MARPRGIAALAAALCLLLGGCVTKTLWESHFGSREDEEERAARDDDDDSVLDVLVLTPFALVVDVVTLPLQVAYWSLRDDDDGDRDSDYHPRRSVRDRGKQSLMKIQ